MDRTILPIFVVALGGTYLVRYFMRAPEALNAITIEVVNFTSCCSASCCTGRRPG